MRLARPGLPISRASVIRGMDAAFIEGVGLPGPVLMEHAARLCAERILARHGAVPTVILCGPGNNGGDGYAIARHLAVAGARVTVIPVLPARSADALVHARVAEKLGLVASLDSLPVALADAALVIDAVFGTGQRAPLTLPPLPGLAGHPAPLVAIDVPTGIDADTGERAGEFPEPAWTVTIGRLKPFLFRRATPWELVDIGLELAAKGAFPSEAVLVERVALLPFPADTNKWDRGHVGVIAGSAEKAGAGALAALGALRAGAGLVTLYVPKAAWGRLGALAPEVMVEEPVVEGDQFVPGPLARCDALVLGPGLGRGVDAPLRRLWSEHPRPCVFDADALRALDGSPSAHPRLLTPHAGEVAHLLSRPWAELEADRLATARALRGIAPTIYKGACPIVTGEPLAVLRGGVPALGAGGSGDVLAGIAGALLAARTSGHVPRSGADVEGAALAAAWLHQRAGALCGGVGARASEVADRVPEARAEAGRGGG